MNNKQIAGYGVAAILFLGAIFYLYSREASKLAYMLLLACTVGLTFAANRFLEFLFPLKRDESTEVATADG